MSSLQLLDNVDAWVAGIPAGWKRVQLKHVVTKLARPIQPDDEIVICTNKGTVVYRGENNSGLVSLTGNGYQGVIPGDLLIHGMDTWHGAIAVSGIQGQCTSVVHVCDSDEDKRYLAYYLRTLAFRGVYKAFSNGVRQNTSDFRSWTKAGEIPVILPPRELQRRIADFLDEKCAQIDRAITSAEQSIQEYMAYEDSLIIRAITRGLGSGGALRDSGVPSIGQMRSSWRLVAVKRLATFLNGDRSDNYPSGDDIRDEGVPFVTSADLNGHYLPSRFSKYITEEKYASLRGAKLRKGDIVFCLRGSVGKCSLNLSENSGTIASSLTVARPINCSPEWLSFALASPTTTDQAIAMAIGATSINLAASILSQALVPLPPLDEQRRIADFLDEKCAQIDRAVEAKQAIIDELKAYKKSLIYEAVTGKREV